MLNPLFILLPISAAMIKPEPPTRTYWTKAFGSALFGLVPLSDGSLRHALMWGSTQPAAGQRRM